MAAIAGQPGRDLASLRAAFEQSAAFDVLVKGDSFIAIRRRLVPSRRLFRMLFPAVVTRVALVQGAAKTSTRPDGWAWFMIVMCLGGVFVELTMSRVTYPREYPPEFIYGVAAFIVANTVIELLRTRRIVAFYCGQAMPPRQ